VAIEGEVCGLLHLREEVGLKLEIEEGDRQMVLRALAIQGLCYPGFEYSNREIAKKLLGEGMYDSFRELLQDDFDSFELWTLDLGRELKDEVSEMS